MRLLRCKGVDNETLQEGEGKEIRAKNATLCGNAFMTNIVLARGSGAIGQLA